jgi:phosphotransferase system IIB component
MPKIPILYTLLRVLGEFDPNPSGDGDPNPSMDGVAWLDELMNNLWWLIIVTVIFIVFIVYVTYFRKTKAKIPLMSEEAISLVIKSLGEESNLHSASIEGARLSLKVKNIKICDLESIKQLGALGIFVSGNSIKLMFPFDASDLVNRINSLVKGEKLHD